jgi:diguanylate cyclase (GGDEF)-like protein
VLTGLGEREEFEVRVMAEASRAHQKRGKLAVCLLDLDRLRHINQEFGRDAGDEVLRSVARNLAEVGGRNAVFRVGGDEFAIIFAGLDSARARAAMRRFAKTTFGDAGCRRIGLSWGVAATSSGDARAVVACAHRELTAFKRTRLRRPELALTPHAAAA